MVSSSGAGGTRMLPGFSAAEAAGLRDLARALRPREDELAERLIAAYRAEIPQYAQVSDPLVLADMTAVSLAGLRSWFDFLERDRPVDADLLRPVLEAIRRRAVQGVGMDAMMRAYRIAARVVWLETLELPVDQELVAPLSTRMLEFTDRLTTAAEQAYADEALRSAYEPELTRSALFEAILSDRGRDQYHLAAKLNAPHCVVVVEVPQDAPGVSLDDVAAALVREARAGYWTTRLRSVVAACPIDAAGGRDALLRRLARFTNARRPFAVAVGAAADGPDEIRHSYREAIEAMQVGTRLGAAPGAIHDCQELAPLAALVADTDRARRFAQGCLQPLGRLADRGWVLPTLSAYLRCQGKLKEVAAELAVHPNTVRYRLNELRPFLDAHAADGDQSAALLLAVRVTEYLDTDTPGMRTDLHSRAEECI
jgi:DNA-binding PucR family transcriptional regulator